MMYLSIACHVLPTHLSNGDLKVMHCREIRSAIVVLYNKINKKVTSKTFLELWDPGFQEQKIMTYSQKCKKECCILMPSYKTLE